MPRICHIFDESTGWEQRVAVGQLIRLLPSDRFTHDLVAIDRRAMQALSVLGHGSSSEGSGSAPSEGRVLGQYPITLCARRFGLNISASISLRAHFAAVAPDLIHAWGASGAVAARAASDAPVGVSLFDPVMAVRHVKALRTLTQDDGRRDSNGDRGGAASSPLPDERGADGGPPADGCGVVGVACSCEIVRRRLIEGGLDERRTVVIRPGVEFARVNAAVRSDLRQELGVQRHEKLVIAPFGSAFERTSNGLFSPFGRKKAVINNPGLFDTAWAVTLLNHVHGGYRIILPRRSAQTEAIARFIAGLPTASPVVYVGGEGDEAGCIAPFEELVALSDMLVVPVRGDTSTTAIAWAMASKTAVIGSAVYSVAEILANKVNGLLFKPPRASMTVAIAKLLADDASLDKVRETARGQAYEVFSLRRFVDDYQRFYANLLGGHAAAEGIGDSARVA